MKGTIFNIERFSTHDGPGIRTTVFLKGCPLFCPWCHNPEGFSTECQITYHSRLCIHCCLCIKNCVSNAILYDGQNLLVNREKCIQCGKCAEVCPSGAMEQIGQLMMPEEVWTEVEKDRLFYEESGGGVTFSGGEPLLQEDFLLECLKILKRRRISTAVDTSGYAKEEVIRRISPYTDLFLYDIKLMDRERHKTMIGVEPEQIFHNLSILAEERKNIYIRMPIIPGVNDGEEETEERIHFLKKLAISPLICLLPYHGIAREKYRRLFMKYRMGEIAAPARELMENMAERYRENGFQVRIGG